MKCPFCGRVNSHVLESRVVEEGVAIRRRRKCLSCDKRFTTYEKVKNGFLWVIKRDGRRELFEKDKVRRGVLRAVEKRPVSQAEIEELIEGVERVMLKRQREEVSSELIGKEVLKRLKKLDKVAWLRFASVYLKFGDLADFEKAMKES
jgi:transcriptional repressor NrdR